MIIVTAQNLREVIAKLSQTGRYAVDTETTGVRVFHGDRLFSLVVYDGHDSYYFNFQTYDGISGEHTLDRRLLPLLRRVFENPDSCWFAHNAGFDLHVLANEGLEIEGGIWCTQALSLIENNDHMKYSLAACGERIGEKKSEAVEDYISENKLYTQTPIPGKKTKEKRKHFDMVPFGIISEYACQDAVVAYRLGEHQREYFKKWDEDLDKAQTRLARVTPLVENEKRLTKTIHRMERVGLKVDREYCERAIRFEEDRARRAGEEFKRLTGRDYQASPKLFAEVFADQRAKWVFTDKGNPSFDGDVLASFEGSCASAVNVLRDAKSKSDFYMGFIYHADQGGRIHPSLKQSGAAHGRFASSNPNIQNLKKDNEDTINTDEFVVRRAIVPTEGYFFVAIDYQAAEYRLALDLAGETGLIQEVLQGKDVHQAVADLAGVDRKTAKMVNFALLYGSGVENLAGNLKVPVEKARALRDTVLGAIPNVDRYNRSANRTAANRGYVVNWFGRILRFPNSVFSYRALNYLISGGCADIMKIAMNEVDEYLQAYQSRMVCNVHDEILLEVKYGEEEVIEGVRERMERAYPYRSLPQACSIEYSRKSWADLEEWVPVEDRVERVAEAGAGVVSHV